MLHLQSKSILLSALTATSLLLSGCGDAVETMNNAMETQTLPTEVTTALSETTLSPLSENLKNDLAFMGNEERLAYDVYNKLYESYPELKQLQNIPQKSEIKHIEAVKGLIAKYEIDGKTLSVTDVEGTTLSPDADLAMVAGKYDIQEIQDLYDMLIEKGESSASDALEVGCMVEVVDVDDLDRIIAESGDAPDALAVFNFLRDGSYNHYWAFDKGLKNLGVTEGCCSLGEAYCKTEVEYPQEEKGTSAKGSGHGRVH